MQILAVLLIIQAVNLSVFAAVYRCSWLDESWLEHFVTCNFQNISYTNRDEKFIIEVDNQNELHTTDDVIYVRALYSVINYFPVEILREFANLESLDLSRSQLKEIDKPLRNCGNLQTLNLQFNDLVSIERVFDECTSLVTISLGFNKIATIHSASLKEQKEIQFIDFRSNSIEDLAPGTFIGLEKLEQLDISRNQLTLLRMSSFGVLPQLETFLVGNNQLKAVSKKFFDNFPKLIFMNAGNAGCIDRYLNDFATADVDAEFNICFKDVASCINSKSDYGDVCEVDQFELLPGNEIAMIDGNYPSEAIRYVHANEPVRMHFISEKIFEEFENLTRLELKNVKMRNFNKLERCSSLTVLSLEDNDLNYLPYGAFEKCVSLEAIYLSGNRITTTPDQYLSKGPKHLEILHHENLPSTPQDWIESLSSFGENTQLRELSLSLQINRRLSFSQDCWNFTRNLETLRLESNFLTTIFNSQFRYLNVLESLSLAHNQIAMIEGEAFVPLLCLRNLDLSHNSLSTFELNLFTKLANLTHLNLDHNNFDEMPEALNLLHNLTELSLANNNFQTLPRSLGFPSLKHLNLMNNKIVSIHVTAFELLINLHTLKLSGNECTNRNFDNIIDFKKVHEQLSNCYNNFEPCKFTESKFGYSCKLIMDPSEGEIRQHLVGRVDDDVKYLQLNSKPLKVDLNLLIDRFEYLARVELWNSSVTKLDALKSCSNLSTFDLRHSKIGNLIEKVFSTCAELSHLILPRNEIAIISTETFDGLSNLHLLDLSFNEIANFPSGSLKSMVKLKILKLSHNQIQNLKTVEEVEDLLSLTILDLSHNTITSVNLGVFSNHAHLKELHLNDNQIERIYPTHLHNLLSLVYLNLAGNKIKELMGWEHVQPLSKLQYLDVSDNEITSIDFDFSTHLHLTNFHARNNVCIDESFDDKGNFFEEALSLIRLCYNN